MHHTIMCMLVLAGATQVALGHATQAPGSVSVACVSSTDSVSSGDRWKNPDTSTMTSPEYCIPPAVTETRPSGINVKQLQQGKKPNFIVILTDDQGWDDLGLNNPAYVHTPNLDRFMRKATRFDNFYVTPQCAQSRAALLTGRMPARTGTMLVHGGYDFINSAEATAAEVMDDAGYNSVHYGKWHNGRTLGYEPWNVGFNESWLPPMGGEDALVSVNGTYVQAKEFLDATLMDQLLGYLNAQENSSKPFYMYYAPHAIHTSRTEGPFQGKAFRLYPERYRQRYNDARFKHIADSTIDAWAMTEYLDDVLGRLIDYLDSSPLGESTYLMIMSDNGPQLLTDERRDQEKRIPSKMQGAKSLANEAGIRNFLAVSGPGVQGGVVDSTLLHLIDVLPTMADLADIPADAGSHKPWEGISFKNLLVPTGSPKTALATTVSRRGLSLANTKQTSRFVFALSPHCWDSDAVPMLGPDREVLRPQPLFDYDKGGVPNSVYWKLLPGLKSSNPGFEMCIAVRHKDYKWLGATGKVYRFTGDSHVELPCNELQEPQASAVAKIMSAAARSWWQSVINESSSFTKPMYYLGLDNWRVTNMLADGAHDRTPGNITLLPNGATGFKGVGDRMCFKTKVVNGGAYDVSIFYTSKQWAVFKLSVGPYNAILSGSAPTLKSTLPAMGSVMKGSSMGTLNLPASGPDDKTEACLELLSAQTEGSPVFANFANIRFTRRAAENETLLDSPATLEGEDEPLDFVPDTSRTESVATAAVKKPTTGAPMRGSSRSGSTTHKAAPASGPKGATAGKWQQPPQKPAASLPKSGSKNSMRAAGPDSTAAQSTADAQSAAVAVANADNAVIEIPKGPPGRRLNPAVKPPPVAIKGIRVPSNTQEAAAVSTPFTPAASTGPAASTASSSSSLVPPPGLDTKDAPVALPAPKVDLKNFGPYASMLQSGMHPEAAHAVLRQKYHWPEGQGVMESMFSPYDAEDINMCEACKPQV